MMVNDYGSAHHLLKLEQNMKYFVESNQMLTKVRSFNNGGYCVIDYYRIENELLGNIVNRMMFSIKLYNQDEEFCGTYRCESSRIHIEEIAKHSILLMVTVDDYIVFNTLTGHIDGYYFLGNNGSLAQVQYTSLSQDSKSLALGLKNPFNQDEFVVFDLTVFPFKFYTRKDFNLKSSQCRLVGWMDSVLLVHTAGKYKELDLKLLKI